MSTDDLEREVAYIGGQVRRLAAAFEEAVHIANDVTSGWCNRGFDYKTCRDCGYSLVRTNSAFCRACHATQPVGSLATATASGTEGQPKGDGDADR